MIVYLEDKQVCTPFYKRVREGREWNNVKVWESVCQIPIEICDEGWTMVSPHDLDEKKESPGTTNLSINHKMKYPEG